MALSLRFESLTFESCQSEKYSCIAAAWSPRTPRVFVVDIAGGEALAALERPLRLAFRGARGPHAVRSAAERALLPGGGLQAALREGGGPGPGQRQAEVHGDPPGQGAAGAQHAAGQHGVTHAQRRSARPEPLRHGRGAQREPDEKGRSPRVEVRAFGSVARSPAP